MSLSRVIIKNYKSIKHCDVTLSGLNVLIGENGTGKTNLLEAINYFYNNLSFLFFALLFAECMVK